MIVYLHVEEEKTSVIISVVYFLRTVFEGKISRQSLLVSVSVWEGHIFLR